MKGGFLRLNLLYSETLMAGGDRANCVLFTGEILTLALLNRHYKRVC